MEIVSVPITSLSPHSRNYRSHPEAQLAHLQASLQEFGWARNVVISSDNVILAGHGIVEAARRRGETEVPVHRLNLPSTDPKAEKFMVLENEVSRLAEDDETQLAALLADVQSTEGLDGTGWDDGALDALIGELAKQDRENAPLEDPGPEEPPVDPVTKPGDVWLMGEHRLVCGDCTDGAVVEAVMCGEKAALFATDPPYGCNAGNIGFTAQRDEIEAIKDDDLRDEAMQHFLESVFAACLPHLRANAAWYLWHPMLTQGYFTAAAAAAAVIIHRQIIWVKEQFIFGRGDYHWQHELCFYGWVKGNRPPWYGERNQSTIWNVAWGEKRGDVGHPTAKPPDLFARAMANHCRAGEFALEPFCGSGSQIIAAEQRGVTCRAIEIEPRYVDVAVRRWCKATGRTATLESTGEPFPMPAPEGA